MVFEKIGSKVDQNAQFSSGTALHSGRTAQILLKTPLGGVCSKAKALLTVTVWTRFS